MEVYGINRYVSEEGKLLIDSSHNVDFAAYVDSEVNGGKEMAYSDT